MGNSLSILEQLRRVSKKRVDLDSKPHQFGTSQKLHYAEMYLIEVIGDNEGLSVTAAAKNMGVTKGAVSQTLKKLVDKGIVEKLADPENSSRTCLSLNNAGYVLLEEHKKWHEEKDKEFVTYLDELSDSDSETILSFLGQYDSFLDKRNE